MYACYFIEISFHFLTLTYYNFGLLFFIVMKKYEKLLLYSLTILMCVSVRSFGKTIIGPCGVSHETVAVTVDKFKQKDAALRGLKILPKGQFFYPLRVSKEDQKKLKRVAAYDIGSTAIKFRLADVDPFTRKMVNVIYATTVHLPFKIGERCSDDFIERLVVVASLKALVEEYFPHYNKIEHYAVATAGFRDAGERGHRLAQDIVEMTGIDFKVIDQEYEGLLAYYSVVVKEPAFNDAKDIVWDIGGGSSQLIAIEQDFDKEELRVLGIAIGATKFNDYVLKNYEPEAEFTVARNPESSNPMSFDRMLEIIDDTKYLLSHAGPSSPISHEDIEFIKSKVESGGNIYGIGPIHNFAAKHYVDKNIAVKKYYTKEDIMTVLELMADHDDTYIYNELKKDKKADPVFTKMDTTPLILVYAMMDLFKIDKVYPINVTNAEGIIIKSVIDSDNNKKDRW